MSHPKLPIPDGQRTRVFRQIVSWLERDPILSRVLGGDGAWKVFAGNPNDVSQLSPLHGGQIRIYPAPGPMNWVTVDSMIAPLYINIECCVRGLNADDVLNLQEAIENALYPSDDAKKKAMQNTLVAPPLFCMTGLIEFSMPIWDRSQDFGSSGNWYPVGQMRIDIRRSVAV